MHQDFALALEKAGLAEIFEELTYYKRKEFVRQVTEAKADDTRLRWLQKSHRELEGPLSLTFCPQSLTVSQFHEMAAGTSPQRIFKVAKSEQNEL